MSKWFHRGIDNAFGKDSMEYQKQPAWITGYEVGCNDSDDRNPHKVGTLEWALWIEGEYSGGWEQ